MPNKEPDFVVTDRRRFSDSGESNAEQPSQQEEPKETAPQAVQPAEAERSPVNDSAAPPPPTAQEQKAQHDAFKASSKQLDEQLKAATGRNAQEFEMNFERFVASLYMTALMQLGLMQEEGGQPRVDLFGARQTIDTIVVLREKTKGNLTPAEENLLNNSLYELQMAYVEVMNAVNRKVQPVSGPGVLPFQKK